MKRALRIFVRIVTLPLLLLAIICFYFISLCFVLIEWLFENGDKFYSYADNHADMKKDIKNYFLNFFR
jgi:hypothetical protein